MKLATKLQIINLSKVCPRIIRDVVTTQLTFSATFKWVTLRRVMSHSLHVKENGKTLIEEAQRLGSGQVVHQ